MTRKSDIHTRLDEAAIRLFARQGVAGTSVRDIATMAKIADGSLYRHYSSKEDMARKLFERHYARLGSRFRDSAGRVAGLSPKLHAVIADAYALFDNEPELFSFLLLSQHDHLDVIGEVDPSPVDVVRDFVRAAMEAGEIPAGDSEFAASLVFGIALQPAVFTVYGRLRGPLLPRAAIVADTAHLALAGKCHG